MWSRNNKNTFSIKKNKCFWIKMIVKGSLTSRRVYTFKCLKHSLCNMMRTYKKKKRKRYALKREDFHLQTIERPSDKKKIGKERKQG